MEKHFQEIIDFYKKAKRMPSYQEIMKLTGFRSKNAVFKLINKLVQAGLIEKDSQGTDYPQKDIREDQGLRCGGSRFPIPCRRRAPRYHEPG